MTERERYRRAGAVAELERLAKRWDKRSHQQETMAATYRAMNENARAQGKDQIAAAFKEEAASLRARIKELSDG